MVVITNLSFIKRNLVHLKIKSKKHFNYGNAVNDSLK